VLLESPAIDDPQFRAALAALRAGDVMGLCRLIDAERA